MPGQSQGIHELSCFASPVVALHVQPAYMLLQP